MNYSWKLVFWGELRRMKISHRPYLLCLVISLLAACKTEIKSPDFLGLKNLKVHTVGFRESRLKMDIHIFNPNKFSLQARYADLDISVENRPLGKTILDTLIEIPALDSLVVPVELKLDMKQLLPHLLSAATKDSVDLGVEGYVKLRKAGISMNWPVHYRGRKKIEF